MGSTWSPSCRPTCRARTGSASDDAAFLARNGFNVVRLGVIYGGVEPSPGPTTTPTWRDRRDGADAGRARHLHAARLPPGPCTTSASTARASPPGPCRTTGCRPAGPRLPRQLPRDAGAPARVRPLLGRLAGAGRRGAAGALRGGVGTRGGALRGQPPRARATTSSTSRGRARTAAPCLAPTGCPAFDAQLGAFQAKAIAAIRGADRRHLVWYEPNPAVQPGRPAHAAAEAQRPPARHVVPRLLPGRPCRRRARRASAARSRTRVDALGGHRRRRCMLTEFGATNDTATLTRVASEADDADDAVDRVGVLRLRRPDHERQPAERARRVVVDPKQAAARIERRGADPAARWRGRTRRRWPARRSSSVFNPEQRRVPAALLDRRRRAGTAASSRARARRYSCPRSSTRTATGRGCGRRARGLPPRRRAARACARASGRRRCTST